jgi:hypothetical protein
VTDIAHCELPTWEEVLGPTASAILAQAAAVCALPAGWDLADAASIDSAAASNAVHVALKVTCPECLAPTMSPTVAGNVLIDWTWGDEHVEIEVFPDGRLEVLVNVGLEHREFETSIENEDHLRWLAFQVTGVGIARLTPPT